LGLFLLGLATVLWWIVVTLMVMLLAWAGSEGGEDPAQYGMPLLGLLWLAGLIGWPIAFVWGWRRTKLR
jgi:hypothetical protein